MTEIKNALQIYNVIYVENSRITIDESCLREDSYEVNLFRFIINGLGINIIGLFGILGNILTIVILLKPPTRSSFKFVLISLAAFDTLSIIISVLLFGLPGIYPYTGSMFNYFHIVYPYILPAMYPIMTFTHTASVYLTMTVSLERFATVCHPLHARSLCTYERARIYVIAIIIFSVLFSLPKLWQTELQKEWVNSQNITVYCIHPSKIGLDPTYKAVYIPMNFVLTYILPFGIIAILSIYIYTQVSRSQHSSI